MNLGDRRLRQLASEQGAAAPWDRAHEALRATRSTAFPPLLYSYDPSIRAGAPRLLEARRRPGRRDLGSARRISANLGESRRFQQALNPAVAREHYATCRWGGCHPSRGEAAVEWRPWRESGGGPADEAALGRGE